MWTSPNHLGLLAVVGHFTSEKGKLLTATLGLKELQGEHSRENRAGVVLDMLNDFGIRNELGYMVMDNRKYALLILITILVTLRSFN